MGNLCEKSRYPRSEIENRRYPRSEIESSPGSAGVFPHPSIESAKVTQGSALIATYYPLRAPGEANETFNFNDSVVFTKRRLFLGESAQAKKNNEESNLEETPNKKGGSAEELTDKKEKAEATASVIK